MGSLLAQSFKIDATNPPRNAIENRTNGSGVFCMRNIRFFKKTKYGSKRTKCFQGHNHPSQLEAGYCDQLQMLKNNGDIAEVTYQHKFELRVNGVLICSHYPDFLVQRNAKKAEYEIHECKGFETDIWRIKKRLFEAIYPEIPYIVIK